ncbi:hypothetical protein ANO14919_085390 [Xylariales sp. No.14919]|nr:hypothetical protein ANO14919_085390 [Xylariales sp. No.14919]
MVPEPVLRRGISASTATKITARLHGAIVPQRQLKNSGGISCICSYWSASTATKITARLHGAIVPQRRPKNSGGISCICSYWLNARILHYNLDAGTAPKSYGSVIEDQSLTALLATTGGNGARCLLVCRKCTQYMLRPAKC